MHEPMDYKKLANQLMFDLSPEEENDIKQEFQVLMHQLELLEEIDTSGVEPMVYPLHPVTTYLREDEVSDVLSQADALRNATKVKEGHILVPKVVRS